MKITKKHFLADVRHEIEMLREHATDREKSNLDFSEFNPSYSSTCIYGQMTGQCYSVRAEELMDLSCVRIFDRNPSGKKPLVKILDFVNGEYEKSKIWKGRNKRDFDYKFISALEGYIFATDAKNAEIIQYIKGETNSLEL